MKSTKKTPGFTSGKVRKLTIVSGGSADTSDKDEYLKSRYEANYPHRSSNRKISTKPSEWTIATTGAIIQVKRDQPKCQCSTCGIILPSLSRRFCSELQYNILRAKYVRNTKKLKSYWYSIFTKYEKLEAELRFPIFDEKAEGLSHLPAKIWLATLAIQFLVDEDELQLLKSEDLQEIKTLQQLYANLIHASELAGEEGLKVSTKVATLTQISHDALKKMKNKFYTDIEDEKRWNHDLEDDDDLIPLNETAESIIFTQKQLVQGSQVAARGLLDRMLIYCRTIQDQHWVQLSQLPKSKRLNLITDLLQSTIDTLNNIREKLIPAVLDELSKGMHNSSCLHPTFYPRIVKMSGLFNQMLGSETNKEFLYNDSHLIQKQFKTIDILIRYIQQNGNHLGNKLIETIGMSQMCFVFLKKLLDISCVRYTEVSKKKASCWECFSLKTKDKEEEPVKNPNSGETCESTMFDNFTEYDFWRTKYPDILRQVPVILNETEFCLHKKLSPEEMEKVLEELAKARKAEELLQNPNGGSLHGSSTGIGGKDKTGSGSDTTQVNSSNPITGQDDNNSLKYKPSRHIRPLPKYKKPQNSTF